MFKCAYPSVVNFQNEGLFLLGGSKVQINAVGVKLGGIGGTITLQDTSADKPFKWIVSTSNFSTDGHGFYLTAKVAGDANQVMNVEPPNHTQSGCIYFMGDMADYLGTINTKSNIVYAGTSLAAKAVNARLGGEIMTSGANGATISIPDATVDDVSAIGCAATNTLVVDTLSLADGATVRGYMAESGESGCVTVTNSFTSAGKIRVTVDMPVNAATGAVTRICVLRVAKSAGAVTQGQLEVGERSRIMGVVPDTLPNITGLEVADEGDIWAVYAIWRQVVRQIVPINSNNERSKFLEASTWSNNKTPAENAELDFYSSIICYMHGDFAGRSFTSSSTVNVLDNSYSFSNLTMYAGQRIGTWGSKTITFDVVPLTVIGTGSANDLFTWYFGNSSTLRVLGPISTHVTQVAGIRKPNTGADERCSYLSVEGDNSKTLTAKWIVRYLDAAYVNPTQYMSLVVHEQANLGKPFPSFTYDALKVENWQALQPGAANVVLDDATRGIWLQGNAQLITQAGLTLTLESPVTWAGTVHKSGEGTLVLASPKKPRFVDSSQVATPVAGTNVLTVAEGALKVATTNAVDGLALVFGEGSKLLVDIEPANAYMKDWGLYDANWATPISLAEGAEKIDVEFADIGTVTPEFEFARAIATVPSAQADTVKGMLSLSLRGYMTTYSVRDNGNGTSTILANCRKKGFILTFR